MEHPALQNKFFLSLYILLWTVVSLILGIVVLPLVSFELEFCLLLGALSGYLFGALSLVLWSVEKYSGYPSRTIRQGVVRYITLSVFSVGIWIMSLGFLLMLFIPNHDLASLLPLLPLFVFIGFCLFSIVILFYNRLLIKVREAEKEEELEQVEQIAELQNEEKRSEVLERIAIKVGQKIEVILVSDILYVQAEGDYVMIHTGQGHYLKEQTMKYFQEHLPHDLFVRVHRSFIVNVLAVSRIELFEKQNQLVTLKTGAQLKVSATGYRLLKNVLNL